VIGVHEAGLSEAIVDATLRRAAGRRVTGVRVRIRVVHTVDPSAVAQGFAVAAFGTLAADAAVHLVQEPVLVHCRGCGRDTDAGEALAAVACSACGGVDVELAGEERIVLDSIAMEPPWVAPGEGSDTRAHQEVVR
jgi:hydrogenase nickel incorporation protein HypA/HybF